MRSVYSIFRDIAGNEGVFSRSDGKRKFVFYGGDYIFFFDLGKGIESVKK